MTDLTDEAQADGDLPSARAAGASPGTVRVWDPVVRVIHWSLVLLFATAWLTGDEVEWLHIYAGYGIAGLVAIRIVWGFVGTRHARFSDFVYRPSEVASYLADSIRFRAERYLGHNPAGGAMVITLLGVLAATAGTGILMTSSAFHDAHWVEEVHEALANLALILVGLHIAGVVLASLEHGENLVKAMITGRKRR